MRKGDLEYVPVRPGFIFGSRGPELQLAHPESGPTSSNSDGMFNHVPLFAPASAPVDTCVVDALVQEVHESQYK